MIDLHSHILPGIDDGAKTTEDAVDMLDMYVSHGFHTVVATPHLIGPLHAAYEERVRASYAAIEPFARERGIALAYGFEVMLDAGTAEQVNSGTVITIAGTRTILVELPLGDWPLHTQTSVFALQTTGHRLVLAHPERYAVLQDAPDKVAEFVDRDVLMQVNAGSFAGIHGKRARRLAELLVTRGLVHLVATDAHSTGIRMSSVPSGLGRLRELVGDAELHRLTVDTPVAILTDTVVPHPAPILRAPWWKRFSLPL